MRRRGGDQVDGANVRSDLRSDGRAFQHSDTVQVVALDGHCYGDTVAHRGGLPPQSHAAAPRHAAVEGSGRVGRQPGSWIYRASANITPHKSLRPYRERARGRGHGNGKDARGRSVHDTATCTKPPRSLAGQLLYGDSIERLRLGSSVSAQAKGWVFAIALPNGVSLSQSTAKRFS